MRSAFGQPDRCRATVSDARPGRPSARDDSCHTVELCHVIIVRQSCARE